jgi:MATE family multidrug resistance protein
MGFIGAPISVVITNWLLPLFLFLYIYCFGGSECWGGFSKKALTNWGPMVCGLTFFSSIKINK